jgi:hypothetical protein
MRNKIIEGWLALILYVVLVLLMLAWCTLGAIVSWRMLFG